MVPKFIHSYVPRDYYSCKPRYIIRGCKGISMTFRNCPLAVATLLLTSIFVACQTRPAGDARLEEALARLGPLEGARVTEHLILPQGMVDDAYEIVQRRSPEPIIPVRFQMAVLVAGR